MVSTRFRLGALVGVVALALTGCAAAEEKSADDTAGATIEIEDNNGQQTISSPPSSVVATDNRTFETLESWGIELSGAAVGLMPEDLSYTTDESIRDLGTHREPDLEQVVAAKPDLIVNGQRFAQFHEDFEELAPEATVLELDPRDGEAFDEELKRQTEVLGEIFGKQDEAKKITDEYDASIDRAKKAYEATENSDGTATTMGLITSAGDIGYVAPSLGRTVGPVFDILDLDPALEVEDGSEDHQGDDISVEAIADSKPELMLVMDRDASFAPEDRDEGSAPAAEVLEKSEALKDVPAIKNDALVYFPEDTYLNEGIQTYTEFFNTFAETLEAQK